MGMRSSGHLRCLGLALTVCQDLVFHDTRSSGRYGRFNAYPTKLITLDGFGVVSTTEAALIDEVGEILLHELFNLGDSPLQSILALASDMEIKWRRLFELVGLLLNTALMELTAGVAIALLG